MIKRIVRLHFHEEHRKEFLELFASHQEGMKAFTSCLKLELLEDIHDPAKFFTYSTWESVKSLEDYRSSEYFRNIWGTVKPWFKERALAWTVRKI